MKTEKPASSARSRNAGINKTKASLHWPITCWDAAIIVHLSDEIDLSNAMNQRSDMSSHIARKGHLIVDFSALRFIDSAGLAVLLSVYNALEKLGRRLFISGAQGSPRQVLRLTRLDQVFPLIESPFQAQLTSV